MTHVSGFPVKDFTNLQDWSYGPPHGIIFHETAGFGAPSVVSDTLEDRHLGVVAIIDRDGDGLATAPLEKRTYHAYEAARRYWGIEHINAPQTPHFQKLAVPQLEASARVAAELVSFAKSEWGVTIPLIKKGCDYNVPGFMSHVDGKTGPAGTPCGWNLNGHIDGLTSTWTWEQYLDRVKDYLEEDDVFEPADRAMLAQAAADAAIAKTFAIQAASDAAVAKSFVEQIGRRAETDPLPGATTPVNVGEKGWIDRTAQRLISWVR